MEEMGPREGRGVPTFAEKPGQGRAEARQACRADRCLGKGLWGRSPGDGAQRHGVGQSTAWPCGPQRGAEECQGKADENGPKEGWGCLWSPSFTRSLKGKCLCTLTVRFSPA